MKVVGKCSDGQLDHDGDIVSPAWMAQAVKEWLGSYPAVRVQHRADFPAGRGLEAWQDDQGATYLRALIVDGAAKRMVKQRVLSAFSVGISNPDQRKSSRCPRWEIVGGRLVEVSIVDSPSNARCGIEVGKSVGGVPEYVGRAWEKPKKPKKAAEVPPSSEEAYALACLKFSDPALRARAEAYLAGRYG